MTKPTVLIQNAKVETDAQGRAYLIGYPKNHPEPNVNGQLTRSGPILSYDELDEIVETETTIYSVVSWECDSEYFSLIGL
jgi:hypothetical protein